MQAKRISRFTFNLLSAAIFLATLGTAVNHFSPVAPKVTAQGSGAIWTTSGSCGGEQQDVNHFPVGATVYINGSGFDPNTPVSWEIKGQPGQASCDPNQVVASGPVTINPDGTFCFAAYTIMNDDCGEYQVKVGSKGDNYKVDAQVDPTPTVSPSVSPSVDPSPSVSPSVSPSPSVDPSPSISPSPSLDPSPSVSPSIDPSPSTDPSVSPSPSTQPSPSVDPSVTPSPSTGVTPSPTVSPVVTPSPQASSSPTPTPSSAPGRQSSLATDNLVCGVNYFDAVMDVKDNNNGVENVLVKFTYNGSTQEARTNKDGRAKVSFTRNGNGTLHAEAEGFSSQSLSITIPSDCPNSQGQVLGTSTSNSGRGSVLGSSTRSHGKVLGASTLANTGSAQDQVVYMFMALGAALSLGSLFQVVRLDKRAK